MSEYHLRSEIRRLQSEVERLSEERDRYRELLCVVRNNPEDAPIRVKVEIDGVMRWLPDALEEVLGDRG